MRARVATLEGATPGASRVDWVPVFGWAGATDDDDDDDDDDETMVQYWI